MSEAKDIPKSSLLRKLDPILDNDGLLRTGRRVMVDHFSSLPVRSYSYYHFLSAMTAVCRRCSY